MTKVTFDTDKLSLDCLMGLMLASAGMNGPDGKDVDDETMDAYVAVRDAFYARPATGPGDVLAKFSAMNADEMDDTPWGPGIYREALAFLPSSAADHVIACFERKGISKHDAPMDTDTS